MGGPSAPLDIETSVTGVADVIAAKRRLTLHAFDGGVRAWLGPEADIDTHFKPRYKPWDQRLCLVPDGDFFLALRRQTASVVTDRIATFTEHGIALESGAELEADIIVTATGLSLQAFGGVDLVVDGEPVDLPDCLAYKGMMLSGVPNFAFAVGYTNSSWTLKVDLVCEHLSRIMNLMDARGYDECRL